MEGAAMKAAAPDALVSQSALTVANDVSDKAATTMI